MAHNQNDITECIDEFRISVETHKIALRKEPTNKKAQNKLLLLVNTMNDIAETYYSAALKQKTKKLSIAKKYAEKGILCYAQLIKLYPSNESFKIKNDKLGQLKKDMQTEIEIIETQQKAEQEQQKAKRRAELKDRGGWKYLKWGMTFNEVVGFFKKDNSKYVLRSRGGSFLLVAINKDEDQTIDCRPLGLDVKEFSTDLGDPDGAVYFYENHLFGRFVEVQFDINSEEIIHSLKKKYPKGKVKTVVRDGLDMEYYLKYESKRIIKNKIKVFEYKSKNLYVFGGGGGIYFYDPNILKKIENRLLTLQKGKQKRTIKKLF